MPRLRLGVALLIPSPLDREIDALRRAVGDGTYGRVPAHLTLVPPVNVRAERLGDALAGLRRAAAATRPFTVSLGPPSTFLPDTPVLYLPVETGEEAVRAVRDRVFHDPLARPLTWPFVPHVTVADECTPERITAARLALADYSAQVTFDRVHLLQEHPGRVWGPIADVAFAVAAVIGRGGLPVELTVSTRPDPGAHGVVSGGAEREDVTITARRDGEVVGMVEGRAEGGEARLIDVIVAAPHRRTGIGSHLVAALESWASEHGCGRIVAAPVAAPAERLLRGRGWIDDDAMDCLWRGC